MRLTTAQIDRACGAVLGSAVGDALGAGYEFGSATVGPDGPQMIGGGLGNFEAGEWTDDTTMAWCILDVAATGADLRSEDALTQVGRRFRGWYDTHPPDIGNQTRTILGQVGPEPTGATLTAAAHDLHARTGHTAGNGSLMRTAPVALRYLEDPVGLTEAARRIGALTHYDQRAQEACVLWSLAIRHAILHGELDVRVGFKHLDEDAVAFWEEHLRAAETREPSTFVPNGWVVTALQAAWSAIAQSSTTGGAKDCAHLVDALDTAIRIGDDTDTVAAIAGGLLGARWGASAVPARWRRVLHGYPGITGDRLVELAHLAATGRPGKHGWPGVARVDYSPYVWSPTLVRHPYDDGVWLGDALALDDLSPDVTAVVSLCLLGSEQVPPDIEHIGFRLIDEADPASNPNLDFVLRDTAETVAALRAEGHVVLLHCVAAQSRTPTVAIAYAVHQGASLEKAAHAVLQALPRSRPNLGFRAALGRMESYVRSSDERRHSGDA
ncbi:ADP-ribosylglycohydrolase family protein [Nocardioides marmoribigeumensis]|uniref:ADP-ribosylglycohydrolase n=1 Tax=Nocardioides marmoribigeumensis TaxID=433649 RepID=A0ABU2BYA3_9ACTN|nr:ADP-ribosylglycohydrolase family protein [Nocardioides marmoribigeumensis]MDR7363372.1 ADP-ribosylglycohydrolase [Nocardioides marmoribigeumensis]